MMHICIHNISHTSNCCVKIKTSNCSLPGLLPLPRFSSVITVFLCFALTEAPPSGMSKNGYFFQEMGECEPPAQGQNFQHLFLFHCVLKMERKAWNLKA